MAWNKTKPANATPLVSSEIRDNWQAIEDVLGVAPSTTATLALPKRPTFTPGGAASVSARVPGILHRSGGSAVKVGNVGTGEDTLMAAHSLLGGTLAVDNVDHIRVTATGTYAANAANKHWRFRFGAVSLSLRNAGDNIANGRWKAVVTVWRTGAGTQFIEAEFKNSTLSGTVLVETTGAETLSGAINVYFTGEATSNNDITQDTFTIEYFS